MKRLLAVTGPTASGKTALALGLARELEGEIISCDSRQVYKDLLAGTDKPEGKWAGDKYEVEGVPYHLVDILDVAKEFSAGDFLKLAQPLIEDIKSRGKVPILAGGTGMYLRALIHGLDPMPGRDEAIRARLTAEAEKGGRKKLHARLTQVDPTAAAGIPANNIQRVIRALEVYQMTGKPISSFWTQTTAPTSNLLLGIEWPKETLEKRIKERCAAVFPAMIEEVRALRARGVSGDAPGLKTIGYPLAASALSGSLTKEKALALYQLGVLQYAKRQRTWFRKENVKWLAGSQSLNHLIAQSLSLWNA